MYLNTGKMGIWFLELDRPASEITKFEAMLSMEEAVRAQRFRFLRDRNRYVVMHGMLRILLAGYDRCEPGQVEIRTGVNGKPYMAGQKVSGSIHFSASRSEAVAAFAFSRIGSTGIDIEKIRGIPDMLEIVDRHFTSGEKHEIFSCPENQRSALFYKLWTRKEAVLKAQGEGLLKPLDCLDVTMNCDAKSPWMVRVSGGPVEERFWVADVDCPVGFAASVAAAGPFAEITVKQFEETISTTVRLAPFSTQLKESLNAILDLENCSAACHRPVA